MYARLLWLFYCIGLVVTEDELCDLNPVGLDLITNLTSAHEIRPHNNTNSTDQFDATVTFTWDIAEGDYDGILYTFTDKSASVILPVGGPGGFHACSGLASNIWAVNASGDPIQCAIPCEGHLPKPCLFSRLCQHLTNGYIPLPKGTLSRSFPIKFGRGYKIQLEAYRNWTVGESATYHLEPVFCKHALINEHGINGDEADERCRDKQDTSHQRMASGPPADLRECQAEDDLENGNKARCTFRWKRPLDMGRNATLFGFGIHVTGGEIERKVVKADEEASDENGDLWYNLVVSNIPYETQHKLTITPIVKWSSPCSRCSRYGTPLTETFDVADSDACVRYNNSVGYCDVNANCTDLPYTNETAAICTCYDGYVGNGVNTVWETRGTKDGRDWGCADYDACAENNPCDPNAICTDSPPPHYNATCYCPDDFIGNGYLSGSGCTQRSLVVALAVGVPMVCLMATLVFFVVWKARAIKRRKIEKKMSKFFSSQDVVYSASSQVKNIVRNGHVLDQQISVGFFGEKWELDRESIELKGILGRGNFGVVQRAVLSVDDEPKTVAVKMTAENSSEGLRTAFLAEISMICSMGTHENLIGMIGCCTTGTTPLYLVSEFMKYGDLLHFLWNAREESNRASDPIYDLTELDIYKMASQVASGMKYLTDIKIIHGDLAARNILVGEGLKCKISDFGLANDVYRYGMIKGMREKTVPLKWVSPERMSAGKVPVTWRSDVWSYGILLYESVTLGASPYPDVPRDEIFDNLKSGYRMQCPVSCSQYLYDMMLKCWEWTPSKRPAFKEILDYMQAPLARKDGTYVNLATVVPTLNDQTNNEESGLLQASTSNNTNGGESSTAANDSGPPSSGEVSGLHFENEVGETQA